jgi:hypothetical protein
VAKENHGKVMLVRDPTAIGTDQLSQLAKSVRLYHKDRFSLRDDDSDYAMEQNDICG